MTQEARDPTVVQIFVGRRSLNLSRRAELGVSGHCLIFAGDVEKLQRSDRISKRGRRAIVKVRRRRSNLAKQVFSLHCTARRVVATNPPINLSGGAALATNQHLAADETGQLGTLAVCLSVVG
jgi:hypothetical protein